MAKAGFDIKRLKLTEATQAWIERERLMQPNKSAQEIIRERLHNIAVKEIQGATVLVGICARLGIRGDDGGQS